MRYVVIPETMHSLGSGQELKVAFGHPKVAFGTPAENSFFSPKSGSESRFAKYISVKVGFQERFEETSSCFM